MSNPGQRDEDYVRENEISEIEDEGAVCRVCGCTDHAACVGGCWWATDAEQTAAGFDPETGHLCTACLPDDPR
jgi:hypothetical protein